MAIADYHATLGEELDFKQGGIIVVTAKRDGGRWSGELQNDARRQPRRYLFPSHFVTLASTLPTGGGRLVCMPHAAQACGS